MPYNIVADSFHTGVTSDRGATSENRLKKVGDFAPTRSLSSKISGTRG